MQHRAYHTALWHITYLLCKNGKTKCDVRKRLYTTEQVVSALVRCHPTESTASSLLVRIFEKEAQHMLR